MLKLVDIIPMIGGQVLGVLAGVITFGKNFILNKKGYSQNA